MPALARPPAPETITLPARAAIIGGAADVLVVGGGPAGIGAAIGAADAGARVILAERYGFLGGNATAALVMPLMSFHTQRAAFERSSGAKLFPADHGPGEPVVAGVLARLLGRLIAGGGAIQPSLATGYVVPFDPELFKLEVLGLLDEAGVELLFHAFASGVVEAGQGCGVVFETKSGPVVLRARVVVELHGRWRHRHTRGHRLRDRPRGRPGPADDAHVSAWCSSSGRRSRPTSGTTPTSGAACTACGI